MKRFLLICFLIFGLVKSVSAISLIGSGVGGGTPPAWNSGLSIDADLVAWYKFESGAITTDSSGNGHTLTDAGTVTSVASGIDGNHASFVAASEQSLYITNDPANGGVLDFGVDHSIIFWVRFDSISVTKYVWAKGSSTDADNLNAQMAFVTTYDDLSLGVGVSSGATAGWTDPSINNILTSKWYFVCITHDVSEGDFFVYVYNVTDSVAYGSDPTWSSTGYTANIEAADIRLGAKADSTVAGWLDGDIDEFIILNRIVDSTDRNAIMGGTY